MAQIRQIASGLMFPEGPIALPDGSVLVAMDWPRPGLALNFLNK
jgi:sugar lactone lactonase YvrE